MEIKNTTIKRNGTSWFILIPSKLIKKNAITPKTKLKASIEVIA